MGSLTGHPVRRVEDPPLVTGKGRYVADMTPADALHAAFVRSPTAHAVVSHVDIQAARDLSGVVDVLVASDLDLGDIPSVTGRGPINEHMTRPPLARSRVRYVGEPIAVVLAESAVAAAEAVLAVEIELDELEVVASITQALSGDIHLFPEANSNIVHEHEIVAPGRRSAGSDEVEVAISVRSPRLAPNPIEPLGIISIPLTDSRFHVVCSHQAPHRLKKQLAHLLAIDQPNLRVTVPDVGGAFGLKGALYPEYLVVVAASRLLGRGVSWIERRTEHFLSGIHGRGAEHRVTIIGNRDGSIRRLQVEIVGDAGAYPHNGSRIPLNSEFVAPGLYAIPEVEVKTSIVVTNRAPTGSYRGAGRPEAALSVEHAVDAFARTFGLDPFQVRQRNLLDPNDLPYRSITGAIYDSGDYPKALALAKEALERRGTLATSPRSANRGTTRRARGWGLAAFVERAGGAVGSGEYARVVVDRSGKVTVETGSTPSGQGHRTVWSQVVADVFGIDIEQVDVVAGDTADVADGVGTYGSRSTQVGAAAAHRMAEQVRDELIGVVAERWEASADDIQLHDGVFSVAGVPDHRIDLGGAVGWAYKKGVTVEASELFIPNAQTFPYGVHAAVVDVDLDTGEVEIVEMVAVDDCGTVLNPLIVEGQLHGSVMQGIGQALWEAVEYDENGQPLTTSLNTYLLPTAKTRLPIEAVRIETPAPSNPLGAKGSGEVGCIGMPAAILNAVTDALRTHGVEDLQIPLTPFSVWEALRRRGGVTEQPWSKGRPSLMAEP